MNPLDKEEKIIFYIDGARFLPDNVSITKVIVRILDSKCKEQYKQVEKLADFDSTFRNQVYKMKLEMQVKFLKPTSMAYIKIETFDQGTSGQA